MFILQHIHTQTHARTHFSTHLKLTDAVSSINSSSAIVIPCGTYILWAKVFSKVSLGKFTVKLPEVQVIIALQYNFTSAFLFSITLPQKSSCENNLVCNNHKEASMSCNMTSYGTTYRVICLHIREENHCKVLSQHIKKMDTSVLWVSAALLRYSTI